MKRILTTIILSLLMINTTFASSFTDENYVKYDRMAFNYYADIETRIKYMETHEKLDITINKLIKDNKYEITQKQRETLYEIWKWYGELSKYNFLMFFYTDELLPNGYKLHKKVDDFVEKNDENIKKLLQNKTQEEKINLYNNLLKFISKNVNKDKFSLKDYQSTILAYWITKKIEKHDEFIWKFISTSVSDWLQEYKDKIEKINDENLHKFWDTLNTN